MLIKILATVSKSASVALGVSLVALFLCDGAFAVDFPAPISKCHMNDENCLIEQANKVVRTFQHGNAQMKLPDLEPFVIDKIDVLNGGDGPNGLNLYMTDVKFHNFSQMTFKKVRGYSKDLTKPMKLISQLVIPRLTFTAKYKVTGKVLVLPIFGEGDMECSNTELEVRIVSKVTPEKRDGKTFLKINDYQLKSKSKRIHINMTNLFNGDPALSENMLKLLNDEWTWIADEIQPKVDAAISRANRKTLQQIFDLVPYEDFFLPDDH